MRLIYAIMSSKAATAAITYPSTIEGIHLYLCGDSDNIADSATEIKSSDVCRLGAPVPGGVYDAHCGSTSELWACQTCLQSKRFCPGHFGRATLNYPVQSHIMKDMIVRWLKVICHVCGALVIGEVGAMKHIAPPRRLGEYAKLTRNAKKDTVCASCKAPRPHTIVRDKNRSVVIFAEYYRGDKLESSIHLFNHMIADIFDRVSDATVRYMGRPIVSHPRKMILSVIRVPPNTIRPELKNMRGGRMSSSDDVTTLLRSMIEINSALPAIIPAVITPDLETRYINLDHTYFEMIRGSPATTTKMKMTMSTGRQPSSIFNRIPKKTGRIRKNLMGRRVWHAARGVLTCDTQIRVDEVGVPLFVAREIQMPEIVTPQNRDRLLIYFMNKRDAYPGCTKIIKKETGAAYWVGALPPGAALEIGDILMRDIIDGDPVMFNRQPTLRGCGISAHKVVVFPTGKTFRLNISVCVIYNADFDGDEAHLIFPQSPMACVEASTIGGVGNICMSSQTGDPFVGLLQDAQAGIVEMTRDNAILSRRWAMETMRRHDRDLKFAPAPAVFTGRDLISMLLPPINYDKTAGFYNPAHAPFLRYSPTETTLKIRRGRIIQGVIDAKAAGEQRPKGIWHLIHNEFGPARTLDTIFDIQQTTACYMESKGFTVGIDDMFVTPEQLIAIHAKISAIITDAHRAADKFKRGEVVPPIGVTTAQFYEQTQIEALRAGDDLIEPVMSTIDTHFNGLYKCVAMCKKGKMNNFQAIMALVGQILINGTRPRTNFGYSRTLPFFPRYDANPIANGFIADSWITGISPASYIFTAQEARYAVISRELSTSITGAMGRVMIKNMESIQVNNHRQCVANDIIIQFLYGGNGADTRRAEKVRYAPAMLDDAALEAEYRAAPDGKFAGPEFAAALDAEFAAIRADRDWFRGEFIGVENMFGDMFSDTVDSIVDIRRIVDDIAYTAPGEIKDPVKAMAAVRAAAHDIGYIFLNETQRAARAPLPAKFVAATTIVAAMLRAHLCLRAATAAKIGDEGLIAAIDKIRYMARRALVDYGVSAGVISAQSLTEPFTQFIISSHHLSGASGGEDTQQTNKLTRCTEIFQAKPSSEMQNPTMTLFVLPEFEDSQIFVTDLANHIEVMRVGRFAGVTQIFFEEYGRPTHHTYAHEAKTVIALYEEHNPTIVAPGDLLRWCIRIEFDRAAMILKNMDLETIILGMSLAHPALFIVHGAENDETIVARIYIRAIRFKKHQNIGEKDIRAVIVALHDTMVRGIPGIIKASVFKKNRTTVGPGGAIVARPIWYIKTNGSNLREVLDNPHLDTARCQTDSIRDIEELYGIDAARQKIRGELEKIVPEMANVHYALYADCVCVTGIVTGTSKTGLEKREPLNVMLRASFAHMISALSEAALSGRYSAIRGLSAPIMIGRAPYIGTLYNNVSVDHDFVRANTESMADIIADL